MIKLLKSVAQVLLSVLLIFALLEGAFIFLGFPQGANRYTETILLKNKLSVFKPKDEIRIFAYGESSMHGSHYWPYSNPAVWVQAYLKDFLPGKNIRVVNFARMGQGSFAIKDSVRDTLAYQPDFIIIYAGHNTFLPGNRVDQQLTKRRGANFIFKEFVRKSRLLSWAVRLGISGRLERGKNDSDILGSEKIEAQPSGIGPENKVLRHSDYFNQNIQAAKNNMLDMIRMASEKNIPVFLFKPASNLKDFPPSCSDHLTQLSPEDQKNWDDFFEEGKKSASKGDISGALAFYENAASLDDTYAELAYRIANIYFAQGELDKAKELYEKARDNDCLIVRAPREKLDFIRELGESGKAVVLDAEKITSVDAPGGILGFPVIEDNVHFSPRGHARLGRALAQEFADRDWIAPKEEWHFEKERTYEEMARSLGITPEVSFHSYLQCVPYFGHKFDQRIFMALKALEIKPNDPQALRHLAWGYWLKGDRENAVKTYQEIEKISPKDLQEALSADPELETAFQAAQS